MALEDAWNLLKAFCPWCHQLNTARDEKGNIVCNTSGCGYQGPSDSDDEVQLPTISTPSEYGPEEGESDKDFMENRYGPGTPFERPDYHNPDFGEKTEGGDIICPKCDSMNTKWTRNEQTRASDEPETKFYVCNDCGKNFRSYS
jgi:DNA-directed RNA polymerase subunit M/transcription elongation factor TFIIS